MDAMTRSLPGGCALIVTAILVHVLPGAENLAHAASFTTSNFVVSAPSDDIARRVGNCAEYWRRELAIQWLGQALPNWYRPCPISVRIGQMGPSGQTTFTFENGEVHGWKMQVQGSVERVLDSVVPHEINHTIFASYFRRPLPRWADEGAATLFEHESEQAIQMELLTKVLNTPRRIPLKNLLTIREYPTDHRDVLTLYAEGFSLAGFLVGSKGEEGRKIYLQFLDDAHKRGWDAAIAQHYGYKSIDDLEQRWSQWIVAGSPPLNVEPGEKLASAPTQPNMSVATVDNSLVVRSQNPSEQTQLDSAPLYEAARVNNFIQLVPRQLRTARTERNVTAGDSHVINHSSQNEETGERLPQRPSSLSPTAEAIETDASAPYYAFPEARKIVR